MIQSIVPEKLTKDFGEFYVDLGWGMKNDIKIAKKIRVRMNYSKMLNMKLMKDLKILENFEKRIEIMV